MLNHNNMKVTVNNNAVEVSEECSLEALIEKTRYHEYKLAVAVNNQIIPKHQWNDTMLRDGDSIIIIKAVSGG